MAYTPLNSQERQIRLCRLEPALEKCAPLQCSLQVTSLSDSVPFIALSYTWGDPEDTSFITLDNCPFQVTSNLKTALLHLRHRHSPRSLWIDALCINQSDDVEKSLQVSIMRYIYKNASKTIVFLGDAKPDTKLAVACFQTWNRILPANWPDLNWVRRDDGILLGKNPKLPFNLVDIILCGLIDWDTCNAVQDLFTRPWISRIWIVQEIIASDTDIEVQCGALSMPWSYFWQGAKLLVTYQTKLSSDERYQKMIGYDVYSPSERSLRWTRALLGGCVHVVNTDREAESYFLRTIHAFRFKAATDPRDKIYALVGLIEDSGVDVKGLEPDYRKTLRQLYIDAACLFLDRRDFNEWMRSGRPFNTNSDGTIAVKRTLDVLSFCHHPDRKQGLPSWVPNWTETMNWHPLYSLKQLKYNRFRAAHDMESHYILKEHSTLIVSGSVVDHIVTCGVTSAETEGDACLEWEKLIKYPNWPYIAGETQWQAFEHTRIAMPYGRFTVEERNQRINFAAGSKRFFLTSQGYMGLALPKTQNGDLICILLGADVPMALRKTGEQYILVGECYVQGLMTGEWFKPPMSPKAGIGWYSRLARLAKCIWTGDYGAFFKGLTDHRVLIEDFELI